LIRVARLEEIPVGEAHRVSVEDREIAVVNAGNHLYAVDDICSHEHFHLSDGEVDLDTLTIECPKHGSQFSLETGAPRSLPAVLPVRTYGVRVVDGEVWLEALDGAASGARA
jgi:3-phenylpropionate/trans-cinnamate dioxygenase ferredoxin subunit